MALVSMTGFARGEGRDDGLSWIWEVRSVNGKGLDVRARLPPGFDTLDQPMRAAVASHCRRGSLAVSLQVEAPTRTPELRLNRPLLDQLITEVARARADHNIVAAADAPRIEALLSIRGVVETVDVGDGIDPAARHTAMLTDFDRTMQALAAARRGEGARLQAVLEGHLGRIEALVADMAALASTRPDALKAKLRDQLDALLAAAPLLSEERLAQECAILINKADIREELDRLRAHIAAARDLIAEDQPVGRRFDFLCQEFNREANTLCAKSADTDQTRIGLALKAMIDQLREQVANIE